VKKVPPTLADACMTSMLDPKYKFSANFRPLLQQVTRARKFVLDDAMSVYLADMTAALARGGLRKRVRALDNARQHARLPHALTWIEYNNWAFTDRYRTVMRHDMTVGKKLYRLGEPLPLDAVPPRMGWLLQQHDRIDSAFLMTEVRSSAMENHWVFVGPAAVAWSSDDGPIPWPRLELRVEGGITPSEHATHMQGYINDRVYMTEAWPRAEGAIKAMPDLIGAAQTSSAAAYYWLFLATLNDLPISIQPVSPNKGYMARGSYKTFLKHSIIHLTVPERAWRKTITKSLTMLHRRAHQVRGHWRRDWRHPLRAGCAHEFSADMICRHCDGHKLWIAEHQRGDASLGFVTHDYAVHH